MTVVGLRSRGIQSRSLTDTLAGDREQHAFVLRNRAQMPAVNRVMDLLEQQHRRKGASAQICVIHNDQVVLDGMLGCSRDALFYIYSASKPFVALLVHLLAERGQLGLDDPVAAHWPQFAQHGKGSVTIRHVLQHRAGIPVSGGLFATLAHMHDWDKSVRDAECAKPRWPAGQVPAYHFVSYGFILGELVQRVTGRPIQQVLTDEFLKPLGLNDIHLGLPDNLLSRAVPVIAGQPARSSTNGSSTAGEFAKQ